MRSALPRVTIVRDPDGFQRVRQVLVDGHDVRVTSVTVKRSVEDVTRVTLVFPAEVREVDRLEVAE